MTESITLSNTRMSFDSQPKELWFYLCVSSMKLSILWLLLSSTYLCCAQTTNALITGLGGVNGLIINQWLPV